MTVPARPLVVVAVALLALVAALLPTAARGQEVRAVGTAADPVVASVELSAARTAEPDAGPTRRVVVGRADVFADTLAATALAGVDGSLLLTDGGPDAALRPEVGEEVSRLLGGAACDGGAGPTVVIAGGQAAVSARAEATLREGPWCVERLAGDGRVATAIALAGAVPEPSGTVVLARADDWADAAAVGAWAARTRSRVLVTGRDGLDPLVAEALRDIAPDEVVLVGGTAALSQAVEAEAAEIAPTRRIAGAARDATAVAIAERLWGDLAGPDRAVADGYGPLAWTWMFAGAGLAGLRAAPVLYAAEGEPTAASQAHLDAVGPRVVLRIGPSVQPEARPDLGAVDVRLRTIATLDQPLALVARPDRAELWVAERAGRVVALAEGGVREVLDHRASVSTQGEGGLLGIAFDADGDRLFTSSTRPRSGGLTSVVESWAVVGDRVDPSSRQQVIAVAQPATNHNGGDLQLGPDGMLWWSLGDGGGADDTYGNGQRADTLLGTLVRIDVESGAPYAIPPDNPFADGQGGAPEVWAYGLRNPFRFSFDDGRVWIGDVGQGRREEIDVLDVPGGAGANLGWPIWEGTIEVRGGEAPGHVPPVFEERHEDGSCSITGGVVYRGEAIPELRGAYLYSDLCRSSVRAIAVEDGAVTQRVDLGVGVGSPVGFGRTHDGEVVVIGLQGEVAQLVPTAG